jgi:four helix bundle protein
MRDEGGKRREYGRRTKVSKSRISAGSKGRGIHEAETLATKFSARGIDSVPEVAEAMASYGGGSGSLRDRTKRYASATIRFFASLPVRRAEVSVCGRQLLRSGTSVAANFREASRARSNAEFVSKLDVCIQEADETMLWLELLNEDCGIESPALRALHRESDELIAILVSISSRLKAKIH